MNCKAVEQTRRLGPSGLRLGPSELRFQRKSARLLGRAGSALAVIRKWSPSERRALPDQRIASRVELAGRRALGYGQEEAVLAAGVRWAELLEAAIFRHTRKRQRAAARKTNQARSTAIKAVFLEEIQKEANHLAQNSHVGKSYRAIARILSGKYHHSERWIRAHIDNPLRKMLT